MARRVHDESEATESSKFNSGEGQKGQFREMIWLPKMKGGDRFVLRALPLEYAEHGMPNRPTSPALLIWEQRDSKNTRFPNAKKHLRENKDPYLDKAAYYYAKAKDKDDREDPMNKKGGEYYPKKQWFMNVVLLEINGKPQPIWYTQEEFDEMVDCPAKEHLSAHGVKFKDGFRYPRVYVYSFGKKTFDKLKKIADKHGPYVPATKSGWAFEISRTGSGKTDTEYDVERQSPEPLFPLSDDPNKPNMKRVDQFCDAAFDLETLLLGDDKFLTPKEAEAVMNKVTTYYAVKNGEWDGSTEAAPEDEEDDLTSEGADGFKGEEDDEEEDPPPAKPAKKKKPAPSDADEEEEDDEPPAKPAKKKKPEPEEEDEEEEDTDDDDDDAPPAKPVKPKQKKPEPEEDDDDDDDDDIAEKLRNKKKNR